MLRIIKPPRGALPNLLHPHAKGGVAGWLFNEGTGNKAFDFFSNRNHGTINGATWVPGRGGWALNFNGSNNDISVPHNTSLSFGSAVDFSISAWINANANASIFRYFVTKQLNSGGFNGYFLRLDETTGYATFGINGGGTAPQITSAVNCYGAGWVHLVGTVDRDNATGMKLYKNGVEVATGDPTGAGDIDNSVLLAIGSGRQAAIYPFFGEIGEVEMWRRALSATEIAWLYLTQWGMFQRAISPAMFFVQAGNPWYYYAQL